MRPVAQQEPVVGTSRPAARIARVALPTASCGRSIPSKPGSSALVASRCCRRRPIPNWPKSGRRSKNLAAFCRPMHGNNCNFTHEACFTEFGANPACLCSGQLGGMRLSASPTSAHPDLSACPTPTPVPWRNISMWQRTNGKCRELELPFRPVARPSCAAILYSTHDVFPSNLRATEDLRTRSNSVLRLDITLPEHRQVVHVDSG